MLVSAMMCAPWSMPDISDGDSVSPACAKITWPPLARSAFTTAASRANPPRRWPSGISCVAHQVDVVDQDEGDAVRVCAAGLRGGRTARRRRGQNVIGAAADSDHGPAFRCGAASLSTHAMAAPGYRVMRHVSHERSHAHRSARRPMLAQPPRPRGRIGVLLVNLGTPDAADAPAVRRYLKEFLSDPRVIEDQGLVWQLVLNGIILPIRPRIKAQGLPQDLEHRAQRIPAQDHHPRAGREARRRARRARSGASSVDWAMRYGNPSIESRLHRARRARLRAHPGDAALSAIFRGDHRDACATRCSAC